MTTAFVHDWLTGMRGGEKVLEAACELFPEAEIHTLIHRPEALSPLINSRRVHASWLDSVPGAHKYYRYLLPLMPMAIRSFDLGGSDLVISFSHCVAKGVRITPRPGRRRPLHICYCHTPMRYIYDQFHAYFEDGSRGWIKKGAGWLRPYLMRWDKESSRGVDLFVANSENVRRRIAKAYGRDAAVIYPAVDTDFFRLPQLADSAPSPAPYHLIAGALVPYKRVDLAIAACRKLNARLKVVGVGTEEKRLRKLAAGARVEFLGWQNAADLRRLYQGCETLLFPQEEDFGISAVEAMACGKPVIAYKGGGALETVKEGATGVFFPAQTAESLAEAMARSRRIRFDPAAIRAHTLQFDTKRFKSQFSRFVEEARQKHARIAA
jgi:glycosyltransferase involved in cell wall biosynthesis